MSRIVILNPSPFSRVRSKISAIASSLSWISPAPVTHQTTFGETYFLVAALKPCVDMHPMNSWMNCSLAFDIVISHFLRAAARPMPLLPPVTMITRLAKLKLRNVSPNDILTLHDICAKLQLVPMSPRRVLRAPTRIRRPDIQPTQRESRRDRYRSAIFPEAWGDRKSYVSIRRYCRHSPRRASPLPRCPPPIRPNG